MLLIIFIGIVGAYFSVNLSDAGYTLVMISLGCVITVLGIAAIIVFFVMKKKAREQALIKALDIARIDTMSGVEFENYMASIFRHQGYKVKDTPVSGDFGVDLILIKEGIRTAVQIKRYKNKVNQDAVREVVAGSMMKQYKATKTMVVTNSHFTKLALQLGLATKCELVDRDSLAEWILDFQTEA